MLISLINSTKSDMADPADMITAAEKTPKGQLGKGCSSRPDQRQYILHQKYLTSFVELPVKMP